jgi:hypothetical protein
VVGDLGPAARALAEVELDELGLVGVDGIEGIGAEQLLDLTV